MPNKQLAQVGTVLIDLIKAKDKQIANAFLQKGGWEGWLQVELSNALNAEFPGQITVQREVVGPFNGQQRVDILATSAVGHPIAIELKAESIFQSGNGISIGASARDDFRKIEGAGNRARYQFLQFALSLSEPGAASLEVFAAHVKNESGLVESVDVIPFSVPNLDFLLIGLCIVAYKTV